MYLLCVYIAGSYGDDGRFRYDHAQRNQNQFQFDFRLLYKDRTLRVHRKKAFFAKLVSRLLQYSVSTKRTTNKSS